ncbi:MAG TPA: DUF3048 domain-containing protein [Halanaerobiales bacterium]|nr:DUF3048 domain-containing protein [Halanaerobiales bacterium]
MKKGLLYGLVILLVIVAVSAVFLRGRLGEESPETSQQETTQDISETKEQEDDRQTKSIQKEKQEKIEQKDEEMTKVAKEDEPSEEQTTEESIEETGEDEVILSKFNYLPIDEKVLHRAVMVSIENTPKARPQSGICQAPIVYEFLVEGGITRFLALFWSDIPEKIGPIRSVRPYMIEIAQEYDALLLHAGASPAGFEMLQQTDYTNLDQIYNGKYYWRSQQRPTPHNLFTGEYRINDYLNDMLGIEYKNRFNFEEIMIISNAKAKAEEINIDYWGNYEVLYQYNPQENSYKRYLNSKDNPHLCEDDQQITVKNIIVQFVKTNVKDDVGRLSMKLEGENKALYFRNGVVSEGHWQKDGSGLTKFYDENNQLITVNPGKTWIQIVPTNTNITYKESD